ncbi:hypothetical protein SUGI_0344930 [Cryptomeria japonica]|nr:hypothetical protein SUGI_0344930 [Cryptomeria japonica]
MAWGHGERKAWHGGHFVPCVAIAHFLHGRILRTCDSAANRNNSLSWMSRLPLYSLPTIHYRIGLWIFLSAIGQGLYVIDNRTE